MTTDQTISELNDLLARAYDAEKGYKNAAEETESTYLKGIFKNLAQQRYDFGHEIKDRIKALGGTPTKGDTLAAKAHRTWMDLRSLLTGNDDEDILAEVVRGEKVALESYDEAIEKLSADSETSSLIRRQRDQVQTELNRMQNLEEIN